MKTDPQIQISTKHYPARAAATVATVFLAVISTLGAGDITSTNAIQQKAEKPPPLPLHQIEGNGGIFSTLSAYIVNPPREGQVVGLPSAGFSYVNLGHARNLEALTLTESPLKRLELGYGYERFDLGDLPQAIGKATPFNVSADTVELHNFNARFQIFKEGEFGTKWVPALTAGVHYKYNDTYDSINHDVAGTLKAIGVTDNQGVDFTLYASKLFTQLPRPVLVELGGRATRGAWNGLLGFTDNYSFLFEGNVVVFVTSNLALAAEYRQQPNDYHQIPGLIGKTGDWWTLDAAYVVNKHLTLAVGYGHFGNVLNHEADGVWGLTSKWEF